MENTKQDFENRKAEIENYFYFLKIFDDEYTKLEYKKDDEIVVEKIQSQLQITLIANAFLILYNLIEATVRNSIVEIYNKINDEGLSYEQLTVNLKKIWIKQQIKLKDDQIGKEQVVEFNVQKLSTGTLQDYFFNLTEDIINKETVLFSKYNMDFSGNLDAQKIRSLAERFGFSHIPNGRKLIEIKNKRNRLAHGEQAFYEVGREFSLNDLIGFKKETFAYLSDVISKIETFIDDKKYCKDL